MAARLREDRAGVGGKLDRDGLRQLWAGLLAAAMDPARTNLVGLSLIELLKQMEPLDALVLPQLVAGFPTASGSDLADALATKFHVTHDEAFFSLEHLHELGCLAQSPLSFPRPQVGAKGRVLIRAVSE